MRLYLNSLEFIETTEFHDLSISIRSDKKGARAWYVNHPTFQAVEADGYIGSVERGGSTNFRNIFFNPHGHGTHTECVGHITNEIHSVNERLSQFHFRAQVISLTPENIGEDRVILPHHLAEFTFDNTEALIVRTLPNSIADKQKNYSNTNPPYFSVECMEQINAWGVQHLLIDLPSVDREMDGGALLMHNAFWNTVVDEQSQKTITEFIYVADGIADGAYILNLQVAPFENDAAPSRPILYGIKKEE